MSADGPSYFTLELISGDIYAGVPQKIYIFSLDYAANPKSIIFVLKPGLSIFTRIFSGLRSLCAIFFA